MQRNGEEVVAQPWSIGAQDMSPPAAPAPRITRMWLRSAMKQVNGFLGGDEDEVDPLVALVRHEPETAMQFLQVIMLLGGILSAIVCAVSWCLLYFRWGSCGPCCDRPLRLWLVVHTTLQQCQVPARLYFSAKIFHARRTCLEACVTSIVGSFIWRCSRLVSTISYGWLALGIIWVMNSQTCDDRCPSGLRFTCIMMIVIVGLRAVALAEIFYVLFESQSASAQQSAQDCPQLVEGASPNEVACLPCVRYRQVKRTIAHGTSHTGCVVCYSEYTDTDILRVLPCGHRFHQTCVDEWLERSTRCPLCMGSIRQGSDQSSISKRHASERQDMNHQPTAASSDQGATRRDAPW